MRHRPVSAWRMRYPAGSVGSSFHYLHVVCSVIRGSSPSCTRHTNGFVRTRKVSDVPLVELATARAMCPSVVDVFLGQSGLNVHICVLGDGGPSESVQVIYAGKQAVNAIMKTTCETAQYLPCSHIASSYLGNKMHAPCPNSALVCSTTHLCPMKLGHISDRRQIAEDRVHACN